MKEYFSPEFELVSYKFSENMMVGTASVENQIPDVGDDWD